MTKLLLKEIEPRKEKLFRLACSSDGEMPVKEISEKALWTAGRSIGNSVFL